MKSEISKSEKELNETLKKIIWKPEDTIQELYDLILSEGDFDHKGFEYHFVQHGDYIKDGWDVFIIDLNDDAQAFSENWNETCPREFFKTRAELISQFHLKNDGRTILEYYCDYFKKPRLLVPPVPTDYPEV